ncbi:hypothetical protein J6590_071466 [Homalodisca vitripennis]|nr:hypothetical protein J6590_071466 [Homalodisca vitripennis]
MAMGYNVTVCIPSTDDTGCDDSGKGYSWQPAATVILMIYLPLIAMGYNMTLACDDSGKGYNVGSPATTMTLACDDSGKGYNVGSPATTVILMIYLPPIAMGYNVTVCIPSTDDTRLR